MIYNFDKKLNRKLSRCRKWDNNILKTKFNVDENAIPMDLADLDFECAPAIKKALVERANLGDYGYSYCYDEYFDAVINWNKRRYNCLLEKDWIKLTFGTCSSLHYLVQCFCSPGDSVMINTPAYEPFAAAIKQADCILIKNPLKIKNMRYYFNFELMEKQIIDNSVKLFILCSPQNPSGRVWTKEELRKICDICLRHKVLLVCDEIHRDITFKPFVTIFNCHPEIIDYSVLCVSPNKGFNLGGLKSSYTVIKNAKIRDKFLKYLEKVYVTSPHVFAIPAIVAAYNESEEWLNQLTEYIRGNFEILYDWFEKYFPLAKVMRADSSFLVWIDMRDVFENEIEMQKFFVKSNLTMVLGSYFVDDGYGWVRLNIGTQRENLLEALKRMEKTFCSMKKNDQI